MSFTVAVDQFEGPLDLMLHLIKEKELDLFDLDIHVLTEQYLLYLNKMEEMHLEVCSEYLVELATLIEYKSKKLLPKQEAELNDCLLYTSLKTQCRKRSRPRPARFQPAAGCNQNP